MTRSMFLGGAFCIALLASNSFASEAEDMATDIKCIPAKKIIKLIRKFDGMQPEKKDTIGVTPVMQLNADEGTTLPERVYFRKGKAEHAFNMDKDGMVTDFARIGTMDKNGELCMQGKQFIGKAEGKTGIRLSMDFGIKFKNTSGTYTMAELVDGTKDGKSYYKKMFPGPTALLVPKMTHVGVMYLNDTDISQAKIYAMKSGNVVEGLPVERLGDMFVIGIEDLQRLDADSLRIEGGAYKLTPIPSIKKMKKFGFADNGEEDGPNK